MIKYNSRFRLAITANSFAHGGGSERYVRDVTSGLIARGVEVTILARKIDESLPQLEIANHKIIDTTGIPKIWRQKIFDWKLKKQLKQHPVDCIFGVNHTIHADVTACVGTHIGYLNATKKKLGIIDRRKIDYERAVYSKAKIIVAHSELMRKELENFYDVSANKIKVIYPPADPNRFKIIDDAKRQELRRKLGYPKDRVIFLFVSTGHARKGYEMLESIFSRTKLPILLAVAGRPLPRPAPNILELGYRSDIESIFQSADYTILGSLYEPFGLVCIESILCGTPVIVSNNVGSSEIINCNINFLFDTMNESSLQEIIAKAYKKCVNGISRITDPFAELEYNPSVEAHVEGLLEIFESGAAP